MTGQGITAPPKINATETIWFEGPVALPDSQQAEDYPRDMAGTMTIAADCPQLESSPARHIWTDQGLVPVCPSSSAVPEIVEQEIDGDPIPVSSHCRSR